VAGDHAAEVDRIRADVDRVFADAFFRSWPFTRSVADFPPTDLVSEDDKLVLLAAVPGARPEDISVSATTSTLAVSGQVSLGNGESCIWKECFSGTFRKIFRLPVPIEPDKIEASLKDGILRITMVKADEARPRSVKIQVTA